MAKIAYPDLSSLPPEIRARYDAGDVREHMSLRRMMRHVVSTQEHIEAMGLHFLRPNGLFTPEQREIVILTVGRLKESEYEIFHHVEICQSLGFSEEKIASLLKGDKSHLNEFERIIVKFAEEICSDGKVSDETFQISKNVLSVRQIVELPFLVGYYIMLAGFLNTLEIDLDDRAGGTATLKIISSDVK